MNKVHFKAFFFNVKNYFFLDNFSSGIQTNQELFKILEEALSHLPLRDTKLVDVDFNSTTSIADTRTIFLRYLSNSNTPILYDFLETSNLIPQNCRFMKNSSQLRTFQDPKNRCVRLDYACISAQALKDITDVSTIELKTVRSAH